MLPLPCCCVHSIRPKREKTVVHVAACLSLDTSSFRSSAFFLWGGGGRGTGCVCGAFEKIVTQTWETIYGAVCGAAERMDGWDSDSGWSGSATEGWAVVGGKSGTLSWFSCFHLWIYLPMYVITWIACPMHWLTSYEYAVRTSTITRARSAIPFYTARVIANAFVSTNTCGIKLSRFRLMHLPTNIRPRTNIVVWCLWRSDAVK